MGLSSSPCVLPWLCVSAGCIGQDVRTRHGAVASRHLATVHLSGSLYSCECLLMHREMFIWRPPMVRCPGGWTGRREKAEMFILALSLSKRCRAGVHALRTHQPEPLLPLLCALLPLLIFQISVQARTHPWFFGPYWPPFGISYCRSVQLQGVDHLMLHPHHTGREGSLLTASWGTKQYSVHGTHQQVFNTCFDLSRVLTVCQTLLPRPKATAHKKCVARHFEWHFAKLCLKLKAHSSLFPRTRTLHVYCICKDRSRVKT